MALEPTAKLSGSDLKKVRRRASSVKHNLTRNAFSGNDLHGDVRLCPIRRSFVLPIFGSWIPA